jgi:hypothetical protein
MTSGGREHRWSALTHTLNCLAERGCLIAIQIAVEIGQGSDKFFLISI